MDDGGRLTYFWISACAVSGLIFTLFSRALWCGMNILGMFCVRAWPGLAGFRSRVRSLHAFPVITLAQVGHCVHVWQIFMSELMIDFNFLHNVSKCYAKTMLTVMQTKCFSFMVNVCILDWRRGSQTAAAEGSVRGWWKTAICPQNSKGKTSGLLCKHDVICIWISQT